MMETGLWIFFLLTEKNKMQEYYFLHAKPLIPGGKKSIFTVVIH